MCRITNISSMIARRMYATQEKNLNLAMERLSSGLRINRAADDPAGLIASESLRREQVSLKAAISNAQRASNVVATAEGGLNEISNLLIELEGLVTSSANEGGLGEGEIEANQLQIDSILDAITRISNTTAFAEKNLLNGSLDFRLSGVPNSAINDVQIHSARFAEGDTRNVLVEVRQSAHFGQLKYTGSQVGALTLQVAGNNGAQTLTFASGASISAIAASINQSRDYLGMSATLSGNDAIYFSSTRLGEDAFVRVKAIEGIFNLTGGQDGLAKGRDAEVLVNGAAAAVDNNVVTVSSESFSAQMMLDKAFLQSLSTKSFDIVGGGAMFCISPNIEDGQVRLGIPSFAAHSLGESGWGSLNSLRSGAVNALKSKNFEWAQAIAKSAITQVASERGRLGAYQKFTLESSINSMQVTLENVTAAESSIRDADYATEVSNMTRAQVMLQAAGNVLRQANQSQNIILALLKGIER